MDDIRLFYTTAPDAATASRIAETLVGEKLAACVNILPDMTSIYVWDGKIEQSAEATMIIKSTKARSNSLLARFIALHPYETPAIVAISVDATCSSPDFLNWIAKSVGGPGS